jgi:hypothetical protein
VQDIFKRFEWLLGPVGAAKALHLLAPRLFPLWDNAIAKANGVRILGRGENAKRYCFFMTAMKEQIEALGGQKRIGRNPLKALDEFYYCKAKQWT